MTSTVFDKGLFDYALIKPLFSSHVPDTLRIVSGYATHAMASKPCRKRPVRQTYGACREMEHAVRSWEGPEAGDKYVLRQGGK